MVSGLPPTLSIIYINIISYFLRFVKAFNFPFRLPWLSLWFALIIIFLILILYHNYFYMSSTFFIGVRLPLGLAQCDIYYIFILILYTFYIWKSSGKTCHFRLLPFSSVCSRRIARLSFFLPSALSGEGVYSSPSSSSAKHSSQKSSSKSSSLSSSSSSYQAWFPSASMFVSSATA